MVVSQYRVKNWTRWETYGDDEDETVEKLRTPPRFPNWFLKLSVNCFEQCGKTVDPLTYIAVRRYYIVRNKLPTTFNFNKQLIEVHRADFRELVGVSSWMWLVIIILLIIDGYVPGELKFLKMLNTYIAIGAVLIVGTKLMFIFRDVVHATLDTVDVNHASSCKGGTLSEKELDELQVC